MNEREYCLALQMLYSSQPRMIKRIIEIFHSPQLFWQADAEQLAQRLSKDKKDIAEIINLRSKIDLSEEIEQLKKSGFDYICYIDEDYPQNLKNIYDPPAALFFYGDRKVLSNYSIAVVGTRKATANGRSFAKAISRQLAEREITVISGMARGIDTAAHRGALSEGNTIAVLGCGLNIIYPPENRGLFDEIANNGIIISEFPLNSPPNSWHFPQRNRIISGLSFGVLVIEAALKSGALITANNALEQGKDVMAVPGSIFSAVSKGTHKLIKDGAFLIEDINDIMEIISGNNIFTSVVPADIKAEKKCCRTLPVLNEKEKTVLGLIGQGINNFEKLAEQSNISVKELNSILLFLEVKEAIISLSGNTYLINK